MNRPKRGSGERSNWYSGSKFTNWTRFDPFWSEAKASAPKGRPDAIVDPPGLEPAIRVFSRKPHERFCHPCSAEDVRRLLMSCPAEFLDGLDSVYILGGTSKQERSLKLFRYGCYSANDIYLHAYPVRLMEHFYEAAPAPHVRRGFERCGACIRQRYGGWVVEFDQSSLRRFFLFDVLLHELGHHVDKRAFSRSSTSAEKYAEWFAQEQARQLLEASTGQHLSGPRLSRGTRLSCARSDQLP